MTDQVLAAIDGSKFSESVCDAAAWANLALGAPLTFLHVKDNHVPPEELNLFGNLTLNEAGHEAEGAIRAGEVEATLRAYQ